NRSATLCSPFFFSTHTAPTEIYTLSLHDALPIFAIRADRLLLSARAARWAVLNSLRLSSTRRWTAWLVPAGRLRSRMVGLLERKDRKSTRLNSSHVSISYAVFCLKKKKYINKIIF